MVTIIKQYYMQRSRAIGVGILLVLFGGAPLIVLALSHNTVAAALGALRSSMTSFPEVILVILYGTILRSGIGFIKQAGSIEQARIEKKGLRFREGPQGPHDRYGPLFTKFGLNKKMTFFPFNQIDDISYTRGRFLRYITIIQSGKKKILTRSFGLKKSEIEDLVNTVQKRIPKKRKKKLLQNSK